jgi:ADP-ribose pyrophosphatase YjhB (NUDIX family)
MFLALPVSIQEELASLAVFFNQPLICQAELDISPLFDPFSAIDRYGEVCMVIRRPNGRLLTAKKTFYPPDGYRLLTGGINYGEPVLDALLRETHEETSLEVVVRRFLAAVAYHLPGQSQQPLFYTFAFLLDEISGTLQSLDEDEHLEYFREITVEELPERASFFANLAHSYSPDLAGDVADWGQFRAVIHRLVGESLRQDN